MNKEYLNIEELSNYLGLKRPFLYSQVESGNVPYYKTGRLIRFRKEEIDLWMARHNVEPTIAGRKAKAVLRSLNKPRTDVGRIAKKIIEEIKGNGYTPCHGKPDQIKGLGKEVEDGTL